MRSTLPLFVIITIFIQYAQCQQREERGECIKGSSTKYNGTRSTTASGKACQRWDSNVPHVVVVRPRTVNHNYCRNPDNDLRGTWCYTTDENTRWEYCNITKCPEDAYVYWTGFNSSNVQSMILELHADPEVIKLMTDSDDNLGLKIVVNSSAGNSEYWALTLHPRKKQLYYTNYRSRYLAVWDIEKKEETKYFEGLTYGIEFLAIDLKTDNLYWTDSTFKWIMATDGNFNHYAVVHRTAPDRPYGVAIHSVRRYLIFSTYSTKKAKIIRSDLAGKDAVVLFSSPQVFKVSGITIDYEEDRMYWCDFNGYGSIVASSRLDGSDKIQHHYVSGSGFWSLATYNEYVYVSDVFGYLNSTDAMTPYYKLWLMKKRKQIRHNLNFHVKPRGITIYRKNEEILSTNDTGFGECSEDHSCDQLCLPRINASSECACSLGYQLHSDSKRCIYSLLDDRYILFADSGQGKVYQISIDDTKLGYNIVPLDNAQKIDTIALDVKRGYVFWSSKKTQSLYRTNLDGTQRIKIADVHARSIAVDPQTGNVFYVDGQSNNTVVFKRDGSISKTIGTSNSNSTVTMITIDIEYKYVYWTEQLKNTDTGRVMRCRFDGSELELVLDGLKSPRAITIDYQTSKMYVVEAKKVKIFEVNLSLLKTISNISTDDPNIRVYDLSSKFTDANIFDIKIFGGIAYIADGEDKALRTFDFSSPAVVHYFGPQDFFIISAISIFKKTYYTDYIEPVSNPCATYTCQGLCLAFNANDSRCLCGDGEVDCADGDAATEASTTAMGKEDVTEPSSRHEGIDTVVNDFMALLMRVIKLCRSANSPCFL